VYSLCYVSRKALFFGPICKVSHVDGTFVTRRGMYSRVVQYNWLFFSSWEFSWAAGLGDLLPGLLPRQNVAATYPTSSLAYPADGESNIRAVIDGRYFTSSTSPPAPHRVSPSMIVPLLDRKAHSSRWPQGCSRLSYTNTKVNPPPVQEKAHKRLLVFSSWYLSWYQLIFVTSRNKLNF
jgi:hypothetical protein